MLSQNEIVNFVLKQINESEIASIKSVVTEILKIIRDEKSSAKDLKDIIERDPALCIRLIKLANSAYYGYPRTISDIQEAIVCTGFDAVKELALTQKVCELYQNSETFYNFSRELLWQHSLAVAICSKMIYRKEFMKPGDDIYVAGLLHDIGIIVEEQFVNELFTEALKKAQEEKEDFLKVEKQILGVEHQEIGKAISINWQFPDEFVYAISHHHNPFVIFMHAAYILVYAIRIQMFQKNATVYGQAAQKFINFRCV